MGKWSRAALAAGALGMAALGASCATQKAAASPEQAQRELSEYLPLAVGNSWTYERKYLGETGEDRVEIVKLEGGFYVDNRGNQLAVDAFGVRDPKRYLLRHPVEAGREWTNVVSASSMERYRILDVGFTCETLAGTFKDCVRVESKNRINRSDTMLNEITFAPGVGMVRFELFLESGQRRIPQGQIVLKAFALQKQ